MVIILKRYIYKGHYTFIAKNSVEIVKDLERRKIPKAGRIMGENHILYAMDFNAMYTNISMTQFLNIIKMDYDIDIMHTFSISIQQLISFLEAVLVTFNYIVAPSTGGIILRQAKGVPMGGALSYFISEIVTGKAIQTMLNTLPKGEISFIYKYVDGLFMSSAEHNIESITNILNTTLPGMGLKITKENDKKEVEYLEFTATRQGRSVKFTWYKKRLRIRPDDRFLFRT